MTKSIKFGVYIPGDLAKELEELSKQIGVSSRSSLSKKLYSCSFQNINGELKAE